MSLLQISGLQTHFFTRRGVARVLNLQGLQVAAGQILGLVGETGSGKSVTGFSILRLVRRPGRIVAGQILFGGQDLLQLGEPEMASLRGRSIAMIFQNPRTSLNPLLTVGQFLQQVLQYRAGLEAKQTQAQALHLLQQVHISDPERRLRSYPHQLSGGMAQRVMIAAAIAARPRLLIADEPTTGLDVTVQAQIMRLLRELRDQHGTAQILITHDLGLASQVCDQIAVMYAGEVVELAPAQKLFAQPAHPYTRALLNSRPTHGQQGNLLPVIEGSVPNLIHPPSGCRFHPRCPLAMERCRQEAPLSLPLAPDQQVACFAAQEAWHG